MRQQGPEEVCECKYVKEGRPVLYQYTSMSRGKEGERRRQDIKREGGRLRQMATMTPSLSTYLLVLFKGMYVGKEKEGKKGVGGPGCDWRASQEELFSVDCEWPWWHVGTREERAN